MRIADAIKAARALDRTQLLLIPAFAFAIVLLAGLLHHLATEAPGTNSYALLADAFLHGRLDVTRCFDSDCAHFGGKTYVIFPPVPAIVAMPFIAMFGTDFAGFAALGFLAFAGSLFLWRRIFERLGADGQTIVWLLLALAFATPLYYVSIRADRVWFFAQSINFLLVTLAIHEVMRGGRLVLAGIFLGAAFLCRQMSLLLLPFLFVLALKAEEPLISFRVGHIARALKLGLPVLGAVALYMIYNEVRFGMSMETGYAYIKVANPEHWTLINHRLNNVGLFSKDYVLFNAFYLFVQGFHVDWAGPDLLTPIRLDPMGTSLLAASPFVLLAVFTPLRRTAVVGGICAAAIVIVTLFYHGNGFSQYNTQRFVLDWMPVLFYVLALAIHKGLRPAFAVLTVYALGLNAVAMALLAVLPATA
ncbi:MAG: hypothetical protein K8R18_06950 [Parvibaculum sp.]|uniref:hypothetical protein n=1 Tax=Parvibaculum sp. TaxID=2024848 RepID=UPI0025ED0C72|nr:hypothetical protein [Parvibaculum sp.]MCE9649347.1 hypothetical protein [Parvibaculum sp.]